MKGCDSQVRHGLLHGPWVPLAIGLLVCGFNLGVPRLWDRDEPRNAGCAAEMLARGDWIVPTFNGELRTHKPVLLYWAMIGAYSIGGVNEWTARLPSALWGIGTILLTFRLGGHLFGRHVGYWSAVVLATAMMFGVASRAATPDAGLIFFSTLALTLFALAYVPPDRSNHPGDERITASPRSTWLFAGARPAFFIGMALGLGTLAKGPVGCLLPASIMGAFLWIHFLPAPAKPRPQPPRPLTNVIHALKPFFDVRRAVRYAWNRHTVIGLAGLLIVALPWYLLVAWKTEGAWIKGFFWVHNFERAMRPMEGHHGNLLFYPAAILAGFFPWSVFAVPAALWLRQHARQYPLSRPCWIFLCCWTGVYVALFSLARTKLPSYVTPTYPALAILVAHLLAHGLRETGTLLWRRMAFISLIVVGALFVAIVPIALDRYLPGERWLAAIGLIPALGGALAWRCWEQGHLHRSRFWLSASAVGLAVSILGIVPVRIDRHQQADQLWQYIYKCTDSPTLAAYACLEPSWVYYSGQTIRPFELGETDPLIRFIAQGENRFVITTRSRADQLASTLPKSVGILTEVPYFLRSANLVIIGHQSHERHAAVWASEK